MNNRDDELRQDLREVGRAVADLPHLLPPKDLTTRTLARVEREPLVPVNLEALANLRSCSLWVHKFTHPCARVAAALLLIGFLGLLSNLDTAEWVGRTAERLIGTRTTDRMEGMVDHVLVLYGPVDVHDIDVAKLVGVPLPARQNNPVPSRGTQPRRTSLSHGKPIA